MCIRDRIVPYCLEHGILKESDLELVRPSVCNRLDRNTTGLLIAGLSLEGLQTMAEVLRDRSVRKYYYCIVTVSYTHLDVYKRQGLL